MRLTLGEHVKLFFPIGLALLLATSCAANEDRTEADLLEVSDASNGDTSSLADEEIPEVTCITDCSIGFDCVEGVVLEYDGATADFCAPPGVDLCPGSPVGPVKRRPVGHRILAMASA